MPPRQRATREPARGLADAREGSEGIAAPGARTENLQ